MNRRYLFVAVVALGLLMPAAVTATAGDDRRMNASKPDPVNRSNASIQVADLVDRNASNLTGTGPQPLDAPPGLGADDPWVDANGDQMFGPLELGPNVIRLNGRPLSATLDGDLQFAGDSVCLKAASNCEGQSISGTTPIVVDGSTVGLSSQGCADGEFWKWTGSTWDCQADQDTTYDGSNFALSDQSCAVDEVVAGIDTSGSVVCVADQDTDSDTLAELNCASNEITRFDGSSWVCSVDQDTTYDGSDFALSDQACADGEVVAGVAADGTVVCAVDETTTTSSIDWANVTDKPSGFADDVDNDTTYDGSDFALSDQTCSGVVNGVDRSGNIVCEADDDTTYAAGDGLGLSGTTFRIDQSCAGDEILKFDGSNWTCAVDEVGDGDITSVTAGSGLDGGGTSGDVSLAVNTSETQARVTGTCGSKAAIQAIAENGTVTCGSDADTLDGLDSSDFLNKSTYDSNDDGLVDDAEFAEIAQFADEAETAEVAIDAINADKLDSLDSTQFLRSDTSDTMNGALTVDDNVSIGAGSSTDDDALFFDQGDEAIRQIQDYRNDQWFELSTHMLANQSQDPFVTSTFGTHNSVVDVDDDSNLESFGWWFNWTDQRMELHQTGDLRIGGTLTTNAFDVAESYRQAEPVTAGELVRVDPADPTAVKKADADHPGVLGIVSTEPGVLLGGAPASVEALEETWGPEAVEDYETQRPVLEAEVLAEHPELEERLDSDEDEGAASAVHTLEELTLERFSEDYLAPIALSGRVPTQVATTNGPIEAGDTLTVSATPGVAEKADEGDPVVGKALEGLDAGTRTIEVFVSTTSGSADVSQLQETVDEQKERIDELEEENRKLREKLGSFEDRLEALEDG